MCLTVIRTCYNGAFGLMKLGDTDLTLGIVKSSFKPDHSCFRNIVSFARFPGNKVSQQVSRALTHLILQHFDGWAVSNLAAAPAEIRTRVATLAPARPDGRCICCGATMTEPTNMVHGSIPTTQLSVPATVLF